jgi:hypothetical protein
MSLTNTEFASPGDKITIIKEGSDPAFNGMDKSVKVSQITQPQNPVGMPWGPGVKGGRRRGTKTYPRGILRKTARVIATRNPSNAPPTRKRTVSIATDKGVEKMRRTARNKAYNTDIGTIRKKLVEKKIISASKKTIPPAVLRTLYADSVGAGLLN